MLDNKKTMTLNLSEAEMQALEELAERKGVSKTAVVRQALRLYQSVADRTDTGAKLLVENPETKEKAELVVL